MLKSYKKSSKLLDHLNPILLWKKWKEKKEKKKKIEYKNG